MEIKPFTSVANLTPAQAIPNATQAGTLPVGNYKGSPAFWDLDKAVNQPLVQAEQGHILGILDGRAEATDLRTLSVTLAEAITTAHTGTLTVPTTQVWYVNAIETVIPASGGANIITANWQCSLWPFTGVTGGASFHGTAINFGVGGGTQWDEFGVIPILWAATNKPVSLRLPPSTVLTVTFTNTTAVAAATVNCLFRVYGYVGKYLVS